MNPCPQCGASPQPTDKFCNVCGTPVVAAAPQDFGAPPQQGGFGAPPAGAYGPPGAPAGALRCQMGHDITPGASYCAYGHPVALDAMPLGNDQYGGYGQAPSQDGFGAPPHQQGGYQQAAPHQQAVFGAPPQQGGFGAPPQQGGFGAPPQQGGFGAPPQQGGFGAPQAPYPVPAGPGGFGAQAPQGYAEPQQGYAPPYPDQGGQYGGYGHQGGFGAPQQQQQQQQQGGFGGGAYAPPPPPQAGFGAPAPGGYAPPHQAGAPEPAAAPPVLPPSALRGFLVSYQSNVEGEFWPLAGGRKTVGRSNSGEQVDIPLSDPTISSRHATFTVDGAAGTVLLEDTGSTNGTFVNEEHVGFNGKRELRDGDKVRFGGYTTIVKIVVSA